MPSMLLKSMSDSYKSNCHGRGRGFEPVVPAIKPNRISGFMA
jgi:hypothetical protein